MKWRMPIALIMALTLAACSKNEPAVQTGIGLPTGTNTGKPKPIRELSAAEFSARLVGKTFQYTRTNASGFVIYNADGTLTVQDDRNGIATGKWYVAGNQYCESYGPSLPAECGTIRDTGDALFAGRSRLVEMKI